MQGPKISVVITTVARPRLLRRAINSVLAQTVDEMEAIIVRDGPDAATDKLESEITDQRIRWLRTPGRSGPGLARNFGAHHCRADWIAFLDDDDYWLPEKLARQLALAATVASDNCIVSCLSSVVDPHGTRTLPARPYEGSPPVDEWLLDRPNWLGPGLGFVQTSSLMVPRALFATFPFPNRRHHEDWDMVLRAVKHGGARLVHVPEPLVVHFQGGGQTSATLSLSTEGQWRESLYWAKEASDILSPRARSGFCLVTVARDAAVQSGWRAAPVLLRAAFRLGQPTLRQLFAFTLIMLVPKTLRRRTGGEPVPQPSAS